ncbi:MAG: hypothetical protein JSR45_05325 [Proteobacteria bacterium]|nr:hypothetical protein [Pseudomonadota bacterium]
MGLTGLVWALTHPHIVLVWTMIYFALLLVALAAAHFGLRPGSSNLDKAPILLAWWGFLAFHGAVMLSAAYRSVFEPETAGSAYLRVGASEAKQLSFSLVGDGSFSIWPFFFGLLIVREMPVILRAYPDAFGPLMPYAPALSYLPILLIALYFTVRRSIVSAAAFFKGSPTFLRGWELSRGHFWSLLALETVATIAWAGLCGGLLFGLWQAAPPQTQSLIRAAGEFRGYEDSLLKMGDLILAGLMALALALRLAIFDRANALAYAGLRRHAELNAPPKLELQAI